MGIKITSEQVVKPRTQGWGIVHMAAGKKYEPRPHVHDYDEYIYVVKGRCILQNNGQKFEYKAGEFGLFPRNEAHCGLEALEDTVYIWTRGDSPTQEQAPQAATGTANASMQ